MTTELERFDIWAPEDGRWSLWAKPIVFAGMPASKSVATPPALGKPVDPGAYRTKEVSPFVADLRSAAGSSALVIDLPGADSINAALDAASAGYRPVPLFAGCTAMSEVVPQFELRVAIANATARLRAQRLPLDAPPAFLLDSRRMPDRRPVPTEFDNRWQVFPQDFPSGWKLLHHGITRVFVIMYGPVQQADLTHVLIRWQKAGISLTAKDPISGLEISLPNIPAPLSSYLPWYRAYALNNLRQGGLGGFGAYVPEPSKG